MAGPRLLEGLFNQLFDRNGFDLADVVARQKPHLIDQPADAFDAVFHCRRQRALEVRVGASFRQELLMR